MQILVKSANSHMKHDLTLNNKQEPCLICASHLPIHTRDMPPFTRETWDVTHETLQSRCYVNYGKYGLGIRVSCVNVTYWQEPYWQEPFNSQWHGSLIGRSHVIYIDTWDFQVSCELWKIWTWHVKHGKYGLCSLMCQCDWGDLTVSCDVGVSCVNVTYWQEPYWQEPCNPHWHMRLSNVMWIMGNMDLACKLWEIWTWECHVWMWLIDRSLISRNHGIHNIAWDSQVLCELWEIWTWLRVSCVNVKYGQEPCLIFV